MSDRAAKVIEEAFYRWVGGSRRVTESPGDYILAALKAAGIALVEFPTLDTTINGWKVLYDGAPEEVYVKQGEVRISGGDSFSPDNARQLAAALLAAATAAEAAPDE